MRTRLLEVRGPELAARELILVRDGTFAMLSQRQRPQFEKWKGEYFVLH
jgi:hypothetical protein